MFKVQWYPGHMTRAKRKIDAVLGTIDIIIELRDARIPWSSGNPEISRLAKGKEHLIILNKKDLADARRTEEWLAYFEGTGVKALAICGTDKHDTQRVIRKLEESATEIFSKRRKKGLLDRPIRCMVLGISNVGKSSFINSLAPRKVAITGDRPGVTKGNQWVVVSKKVELLDTPGILWPKFDGLVGANLALTGAISDQIYDVGEAVNYLLSLLREKMYLDPSTDSEEYVTDYAKKRGILVKGGCVDIEKAALLLLKDFRGGKLGMITLESLKDHGLA